MKKNVIHHLVIALITIALLLSLLPLPAHADIPQKINYQGYLTDPQGTPIEGNVSIVFSLYSTSSGGSPLWTETQTVTVTEGVFSTTLGTTNPLALPFDTPYYLGITIGTDSEMTPRQALISVAYAFRAQEADSVKDNAVTTQVIANDAVTTDKVADDAISGDKIAPATITSTNIANGAVTSTQIGDASIDTGDLADNAVTAVKIKPDIISSIDGVTNDGGNVDLIAGTNVTITSDDAANTITIASSGGGVGSAWTESGGNVYRDSGNVGIGTSSPQAKLSFGTDLFTPRKIALWDGDNDFYGFGIELGRLTLLTNDTERMSILDDGKVGIGTSIPDQRLTIESESGNYVNIKLNQIGGLNWAGLRVDRDNVEQWFIGMGNVTNNLLFRRSASDNAMVIDASGKVGIGTSFPDQKLTIQGESGDYAIVKINQIGDSIWTGLRLDRDSAEKWFIGMGQVSDDLLFRRSAGSNDMVIKESGNVGIGTMNPEATLTVSAQGYAIQGISDTKYGVYGEHKDSGNCGGLGTSSCGVYGYNKDHFNDGYLGTENYGVHGVGSIGVMGESDMGGIGVKGHSIFGYAGYFQGKVKITGNLEKSTGQFKIDHPLDPENKYLSHSFVESPDMMNVYNGNVILDDQGEAWVELLEWFEALNKEFRYQLTPIGAPGPNLYIAQEISENQFKIAGGSQGMKVSWQVTGIRQDPYAQAHPIKVEEVKPPEEQGYYLHPDVYGQPEEKGIEWARDPEMMQKRKAQRETETHSAS